MEKIVPAKEKEHTNMQKEAQTVTERYSIVNQYINIKSKNINQYRYTYLCINNVLQKSRI